MIHLVKVYDSDCPVCVEMSKVDQDIAHKHSLPIVAQTVYELSSSVGPIRTYIVKHHVDREGLLDIPLYLIFSKGRVEASEVVKTPEELTYFLESWEHSQKSGLFD